MAIIGYGNVSTEDQSIVVQLEQLQAAGCEKIFLEMASGVIENRPQMTALLDYVREGDQVVIYQLNRIARSTKQQQQIVEVLEKRGVGFRNLIRGISNLDTIKPICKHILSML